MNATAVRFRDRLRDREPLIGTLLSLPSPEIAELLAGAGFDWLFLDMEHGLLGVPDVQRMIQAAGTLCACLVRVPGNEPGAISKALDTGAAGLIIPHVDGGADARRAVRAAFYPPEGARSIGLARAQGYGARIEESLATANKETILVAQAESIAAARDICAIAAEPGIAAVFIGPYDLSGSLGKPGRTGDPDVREAIAAIRSACAARRLPTGIFVRDAAGARAAFEEGASLVCVASEILSLRRVAEETIRSLRPESAA